MVTVIVTLNTLVFSTIMHHKDADRMAHSVDPDQTTLEESGFGLCY